MMSMKAATLYIYIYIASQKELGSISGNTNLNHTRHTHLSATK